MADANNWVKSQADRVRRFFDIYTRGLTGEEMQRMFTRDTRDAYRYFSRGIDREQLLTLPWWKRPLVFARAFFFAFTLKMTPARRVLFGLALAAAGIGMMILLVEFRTHWIPVDPLVIRFPLPMPVWPPGAGWLILSILALVLLVLLEVFERLSLKSELEIARDIQLAMLPSGLYAEGGLEAIGTTRPANTVGGDFYDILPMADGRVIVALGDVAGKGSPAALLMALLLAMMRTLVDEGLESVALMERLNTQICRHSPSSRFITLMLVTLNPATGEAVTVNAGHLPALIRRGSGAFDRLTEGGMALGMFPGATYKSEAVTIATGDLLVLYSDGITEAEDQKGTPFDEEGLTTVITRHADQTLPELAKTLIKTVERHADAVRFADDLTVLLARRP
jgi:hypothetical protein